MQSDEQCPGAPLSHLRKIPSATSGSNKGVKIVPKALSGAIARHSGDSPVPVQFDWDKIRTEMKPVKMASEKARHAQKKSPKKKIRSNWRYFELKKYFFIDFGVYFPWLFTF